MSPGGSYRSQVRSWIGPIVISVSWDKNKTKWSYNVRKMYAGEVVLFCTEFQHHFDPISVTNTQLINELVKICKCWNNNSSDLIIDYLTQLATLDHRAHSLETHVLSVWKCEQVVVHLPIVAHFRNLNVGLAQSVHGNLKWRGGALIKMGNVGAIAGSSHPTNSIMYTHLHLEDIPIIHDNFD